MSLESRDLHTHTHTMWVHTMYIMCINYLSGSGIHNEQIFTPSRQDVDAPSNVSCIHLSEHEMNLELCGIIVSLESRGLHTHTPCGSIPCILCV